MKSIIIKTNGLELNQNQNMSKKIIISNGFLTHPANRFLRGVK